MAAQTLSQQAMFTDPRTRPMLGKCSFKSYPVRHLLPKRPATLSAASVTSLQNSTSTTPVAAPQKKNRHHRQKCCRRHRHNKNKPNKLATSNPPDSKKAAAKLCEEPTSSSKAPRRHRQRRPNSYYILRRKSAAALARSLREEASADPDSRLDLDRGRLWELMETAGLSPVAPNHVTREQLLYQEDPLSSSTSDSEHESDCDDCRRQDVEPAAPTAASDTSSRVNLQTLDRDIDEAFADLGLDL
ncbi:hypothetical protein HDU96_007009 [Phlyctochytrium bullatum]|nr:hypothetical protein HDU96_007009 [Phlyctochytrium bullatum]